MSIGLRPESIGTTHATVQVLPVSLETKSGKRRGAQNDPIVNPEPTTREGSVGCAVMFGSEFSKCSALSARGIMFTTRIREAASGVFGFDERGEHAPIIPSMV